MAALREAWGMEIGADAIKAIRLVREDDRVSVSDFAYIPHKKVLTTPDLDQDEMVRLSLGQFISQKSLEGEHLVMSVPGHAAFVRFAKLPPVEPKKIPDIVKFEAVQQIPFPIDEVEWDYQTFASADSPEIEVGIFAITRDRVTQRLGIYNELGISPEVLTLSPVSIYNAMAYDFELSKRKSPVIFLDIGTQATDVIIADDDRCWIRTFPLGGTHFTEAIASAFKLSYSKAEKLKREAATSKYAKQIMQAMRPVFSDLLQDLQRSIGYYQSLHRDHELDTMVGIGSTFKIPGLRKFIGQQLQINVARMDEYRKIAVTGREAAAFAEHAVNMCTAYGLALQGVGLARIDANLVPVRTLREQIWHQKTKWFAAAAAIIVVGAATTLYHPLKDSAALGRGDGPSEVSAALSTATRCKKQFQEASAAATVGFAAQNMRGLIDDRTVWPHLLNDVSMALASTDPQPELLDADIEAVRTIAPRERRLVSLKNLGGDYYYAAEGKSRRIAVTVEVELSHEDPILFLNGTVAAWLRENADPAGERAGVPYRILPDTIDLNPTRRQTIEVDESGSESAASGLSRPTSPGRGRPTAPRPSGPRQPPGPGSTGTSPMPGGGGAPGFGGTPGGGRRRPSGERKAPPGSNVGAGSAPGMTGAGATAPRPGAGTMMPGAGTARGGGSRGGSSAGHGELDVIAPLLDAPSPYDGKARFYRVPVTFELEIVEPGPGATAPNEVADSGTGDSVGDSAGELPRELAGRQAAEDGTRVGAQTV